MEDLRQICVWRTNSRAWWDYVDKFETCIKTEKQNQCSQQVLKKVGLSEKEINNIERCIDDSFEGPGKSAGKELNENNILVQERQMQDDFDISMFPTLFINYQQYMVLFGFLDVN